MKQSTIEDFNKSVDFFNSELELLEKGFHESETHLSFGEYCVIFYKRKEANTIDNFQGSFN